MEVQSLDNESLEIYEEYLNVPIEKAGVRVKLHVVHIGLEKGRKPVNINTDALGLIMDRETDIADIKRVQDKTIKLLIDYREFGQRLKPSSEAISKHLNEYTDYINRTLGIGVANTSKLSCYVPLHGLRDTEKVLRHEVTHLMHSPSTMETAVIISTYLAIPIEAAIGIAMVNNGNNFFSALIAVAIIHSFSNLILRMTPCERDASRAEKMLTDTKVFEVEA